MTYEIEKIAVPEVYYAGIKNNKNYNESQNMPNNNTSTDAVCIEVPVKRDWESRKIWKKRFGHNYIGAGRSENFKLDLMVKITA